MATRYKLSKLALLHYALEGAQTYRRVYAGLMDEQEEYEVDADIGEIERRIKLSEGYAARNTDPEAPK